MLDILEESVQYNSAEKARFLFMLSFQLPEDCNIRKDIMDAGTVVFNSKNQIVKFSSHTGEITFEGVPKRGANPRSKPAIRRPRGAAPRRRKDGRVDLRVNNRLPSKNRGSRTNDDDQTGDQDSGDGRNEKDQNREQFSTPTRPTHPPPLLRSRRQLAPRRIVSSPDAPTQGPTGPAADLAGQPEEQPVPIEKDDGPSEEPSDDENGSDFDVNYDDYEFDDYDEISEQPVSPIRTDARPECVEVQDEENAIRVEQRDSRAICHGFLEAIKLLCGIITVEVQSNRLDFLELARKIQFFLDNENAEQNYFPKKIYVILFDRILNASDDEGTTSCLNTRKFLDQTGYQFGNVPFVAHDMAAALNHQLAGVGAGSLSSADAIYRAFTDIVDIITADNKEELENEGSEGSKATASEAAPCTSRAGASQSEIEAEERHKKFLKSMLKKHFEKAAEDSDPDAPAEDAPKTMEATKKATKDGAAPEVPADPSVPEVTSPAEGKASAKARKRLTVQAAQDAISVPSSSSPVASLTVQPSPAGLRGSSPLTNLPFNGNAAKNRPPAWLCEEWTQLTDNLPAEIEACLTEDEHEGYCHWSWTRYPEPLPVSKSPEPSPPGLHDDSQLSQSSKIIFIGQVRIKIGADGNVQVEGEFSQSQSPAASHSAETRHGAQALKRYENPDRHHTQHNVSQNEDSIRMSRWNQAPTLRRSSLRPSSQKTSTPSYQDLLGSPVLSSPEGSPPAPVSSKRQKSKSVSFAEPIVQCCYLLMKSKEVENREFVAKKTKRLSTSSIPSVPPPVKKAAVSAPAPVTASVPTDVVDNILANISSPPEPTIMGVERKQLAPEKIQRANLMAIKGYTVGKK
ncbi:unnamed protein product [Caenorhabditis brenneri]